MNFLTDLQISFDDIYLGWDAISCAKRLIAASGPYTDTLKSSQ